MVNLNSKHERENVIFTFMGPAVKTEDRASKENVSYSVALETPFDV